MWLTLCRPNEAMGAKWNEIDLDAIAQALQALEVESQKTDAVITEFCKELGIASPFAEVK